MKSEADVMMSSKFVKEGNEVNAYRRVGIRSVNIMANVLAGLS